MSSSTKKAILVVSFGTSYEEAKIRNIESIEKDLQTAFPDRKFYRAWTSKIIVAKLLKRDNLQIMNVAQAMEEMLADGITDLLIQPTHVIDGHENNSVAQDIAKYKDKFQSIHLGAPLLGSHEDVMQMIEIISSAFAPLLDKDEALVLMGHGTNHRVNPIYKELDDCFHAAGHENIYVGTVEAYPSLNDLIAIIKEHNYKKVCLSPFMIVAGDHARNDLAGDEEDSWKSIFQASGIAVQCVLKGLGEYPPVRALFIQHAKEAKELS